MDGSNLIQEQMFLSPASCARRGPGPEPLHPGPGYPSARSGPSIRPPPPCVRLLAELRAGSRHTHPVPVHFRRRDSPQGDHRHRFPPGRPGTSLAAKPSPPPPQNSLSPFVSAHTRSRCRCPTPDRWQESPASGIPNRVAPLAMPPEPHVPPRAAGSCPARGNLLVKETACPAAESRTHS